MRYMEITEGYKVELDFEEAAFRIKSMSSKWLTETRGMPAYRGTHSFDKIEGDAFIAQSNNYDGGRKPLDAYPQLTIAWNNMIKNKGFVANRTNSMFITGDNGVADNFGHVFMIYPIGDYDYTWHRNVSDFYNVHDNIDNLIAHDTQEAYGIEQTDALNANTVHNAFFNVEYDELEQFHKNDIIEDTFSDKLMNTDLYSALSFGHEIYLRCKSYIAINSHWETRMLELLR